MVELKFQKKFRDIHLKKYLQYLYFPKLKKMVRWKMSTLHHQLNYKKIFMNYEIGFN